MNDNVLLQMLAATHVVLDAVGSTAAEHGLTLGEAHVLALFDAGGRLPQRQLQIASGNRASTTSSLLDRLRDKGLVQRERSTDDRRAVVVVLTDRGQSVAASARAAFATETTRLAAHGLDVAQLQRATACILTAPTEAT